MTPIVTSSFGPKGKCHSSISCLCFSICTSGVTAAGALPEHHEVRLMSLHGGLMDSDKRFRLVCKMIANLDFRNSQLE